MNTNCENARPPSRKGTYCAGTLAIIVGPKFFTLKSADNAVAAKRATHAKNSDGINMTNYTRIHTRRPQRRVNRQKITGNRRYMETV
jgi:hypothetical protein